MQIRHEGLAIFIRRRHYRNLWLGSVISGLGSELGGAAVLWMALGMTGNPAVLGLISLFAGVPAALASPLAGVLGDRYSRPRLMALGNVLLTITYVLLAVVSRLGAHWFFITYPLLALSACISPLTSTGRSQLIAELLPPEERTPANFFDDVYLHLTWLAGPAIAGFCVAWFGYGPVLLIDAATYLVCAGFLLTIPSALHTSGTPLRQLIANLLDGVRQLRANRLLVQLAALTFFFNFFYGAYTIFLPVLAQNDFGGATAYGLLWSAFAIGSFIGGILFSRRAWKFAMGPSMAAVIVLWGVLTAVLAVVPAYWMVLGLMLLCGFVYTPYEPLYKTMIQQIVPLRMQAKVSASIRPITGLGNPVGGWLSGVAFAPLGLTGLLLSSGGATVAVGAVAWATPRLRNYRDRAKDVPSQTV